MLTNVTQGIHVRIIGTLVAALWLAGSCQPAPSRAPLGSGELAQAEAARTQQLQAKLEQQRRHERWGHVNDAPKPIESSATSAKEHEPNKSDAHDEEVEDSADAGVAGGDSTGDAGSGDAGAVANFDGKYHGSDTMTLKLPGLPPQSQTDPNAILRVEQSDTELTLVIVDSSKGSDMCSILADAQGSRATIRPDQPCFEEATSGMNGTVAQGSVELKGDEIHVEFDGEIEVVAARLKAPASYSFEGKRTK